ncbi:MAG: DUF1236 domain-containing protein [Pseudomonadota bacterium]
MFRAFALVAAFATVLAGPTMALVAANTTAELNLRSAPSRDAGVILIIPKGASVAVQNCGISRQWCEVIYAGVNGFAAGQYLTTVVAGNTVVVVEEPTVFDQLVVKPAEAAGKAAVGVAGAITGAVATAADEVANVFRPTPRTITFLNTAPTGTATMDGDVVVGALVPRNVPVTIVPDVSYDYAYINGRKVLVDPSTRRIVYVVP